MDNVQRESVGLYASINIRASILAGFLAILVNTVLLSAADHFHVVTARGGLLTLALKLIGPSAPHVATTWWFKQLFHIVVGVAMIVAYAVTLTRWRSPAIAKGLFSALVVWLLNACLILPLICQGFAGSYVLAPLGMLTFAVAHTAFFVIGAILYERWK